MEDFRKGIFAVTPRPGASVSERALLEAARRSGFTPERVVLPRPAAAKTPASKPAALPAQNKSSTAGRGIFTDARAAFLRGDYRTAIGLARQAAKQKSGVAQLQQFLALTLFAVGNYPDSALAAHAALHRDRHWNWQTVSSYYANPRDYSSQLRALEKYVRENTSAGQAHFLLGYHYLILGHGEAARRELAQAVKLDPKDQLSRKLLEQLERTGKSATTPQAKSATKRTKQ